MTKFNVSIGDSIVALLKVHEKLIQDLLDELEAEFQDYVACTKDDLELDDIFILRYVIASRGNTNTIKKHIRKALEWRKANIHIIKTLKQRDDGGGFDFQGNNQQTKDFQFLRNHICAGFLGYTGDIDFPVSLVRPFHSFQKFCMKKASSENIMLYLALQGEGHFRVCDKITRRLKRFCMGVTILDMSNFSIFSKKCDIKFFGLVVKAKNLGDFLHPKMMINFMVNVPRAATILKSVFSKLFSRNDEAVLVHKVEHLVDNDFVREQQIPRVIPNCIGGSAETPEYFQNFKT